MIDSKNGSVTLGLDQSCRKLCRFCKGCGRPKIGDDRRRLNFSRAAEADGHFAGFEDDGHLAPAIGQFQHLCQALLIFQDVDVIEGDLAAGVRLPGAPGVGSELFAKDRYFVVHNRSVHVSDTIKIGARTPNCK
jgi:hypothetical protein